MLRVLGRPNSFNVRKVLWLCAELDLSYVREDYGRGFTPTTSPGFLALNPVAQVPVVIDGELVMRESNAILRYLAAKYGGEALYPSDLAARFRVEQWLDWVAYDLTHAMRGAFLGGQLQEAPWNNDWFVEQGRRDFSHCIGLLEAELARGGPHILGEFTLADIPLGLVVNRWFSVRGFDKPNFPAVADYYEKLTERPGFRAHGRNGMP